VRSRAGGTPLAASAGAAGVLVAALVLGVQDVLAVLAPEVGDHRLRIGGHRAGGGERLLEPLDPDVADVAVRPDERDVPSVWRDLGARDLRIAEQRFAVEDRGKLGERGTDRPHDPEGDQQRENQGRELLHGRTPE
jgi:hypothetical protein